MPPSQKKEDKIRTQEGSCEKRKTKLKQDPLIWFSTLGERTSRTEDTGDKDGKEMEVIPETSGVVGIKTGRTDLPSGRNGFSLIMGGGSGRSSVSMHVVFTVYR